MQGSFSGAMRDTQDSLFDILKTFYNKEIDTNATCGRPPEEPFNDEDKITAPPEEQYQYRQKYRQDRARIECTRGQFTAAGGFFGK
jgi:hypothetical protein